MLRWSCRRFRAEFTPGLDSPHRQSCAACAAYAAALERAASRVPLPARLRSKLRAVPTATGGGPRLQQPQAPLPEELRDRLRGLARAREPRPLPAWVRSSRYAVAASYVLAVLVGATVSDPARLGREAAGALARTLGESVRPRLEHALQGAESRSRDRLDALKSAVRERYGETRKTLEDSLGSLEDRVTELSQSLLSLEPLTDRLEGE